MLCKRVDILLQVSSAVADEFYCCSVIPSFSWLLFFGNIGRSRTILFACIIGLFCPTTGMPGGSPNSQGGFCALWILNLFHACRTCTTSGHRIDFGSLPKWFESLSPENKQTASTVPGERSPSNSQEGEGIEALPPDLQCSQLLAQVRALGKGGACAALA